MASRGTVGSMSRMDYMPSPSERRKPIVISAAPVAKTQWRSTAGEHFTPENKPRQVFGKTEGTSHLSASLNRVATPASLLRPIGAPMIGSGSSKSSLIALKRNFAVAEAAAEATAAAAAAFLEATGGAVPSSSSYKAPGRRKSRSKSPSRPGTAASSSSSARHGPHTPLGATGSSVLSATAEPPEFELGKRTWPEWLTARPEFKNILAARQSEGNEGIQMSEAERRALQEEELIRACKKDPALRDPADILTIAKHLTDQAFATGLDAITIERLAQCVRFQFSAQGVAIVTQGDIGDAFYMILSGSVDVEVRGLGVVATIGGGGAFGELALTTAETRQATVRAGPAGARLLRLTREEYQEVLATVQARWVDTLTDFLSKQTLFANWSRNRLRRLAMIVGIQNYEKGSAVVKQGGEPDKLLFLRLGKCVLQHEERIEGENRWPVSKVQMQEANEARHRLTASMYGQYASYDTLATGQLPGQDDQQQQQQYGSDNGGGLTQRMSLTRNSQDSMGSGGGSPTRTKHAKPPHVDKVTFEWDPPFVFNDAKRKVHIEIPSDHGHGVRKTTLASTSTIGELGPGAMYGLAYVAKSVPHAFSMIAETRCQFLFIHAKYLKPNALGGADVLAKLQREATVRGIPIPPASGRRGSTEDRAGLVSRQSGGDGPDGGMGGSKSALPKWKQPKTRVLVNLLDGIGPRDLGGALPGADTDAGAAAAARARAVAEGTAPDDPDDAAVHEVLTTLASHGVTIYQDAAYYLKVHGARIQGQQTQSLLRRRRNSLSALVGLSNEDCERVLRRMMTRLDDDARATRQRVEAEKRVKEEKAAADAARRAELIEAAARAAAEAAGRRPSIADTAGHGQYSRSRSNSIAGLGSPSHAAAEQAVGLDA